MSEKMRIARMWEVYTTWSDGDEETYHCVGRWDDLDSAFGAAKSILNSGNCLPVTIRIQPLFNRLVKDEETGDNAERD